MPRFHFDLREDGAFLRDDEGAELPDEKAAERQAIETAASVARDAFASRSAEKVSVEVRNHGPDTIMTIAVSLKVERT